MLPWRGFIEENFTPFLSKKAVTSCSLDSNPTPPINISSSLFSFGSTLYPPPLCAGAPLPQELLLLLLLPKPISSSISGISLANSNEREIDFLLSFSTSLDS